VAGSAYSDFTSASEPPATVCLAGGRTKNFLPSSKARRSSKTLLPTPCKTVAGHLLMPIGMYDPESKSTIAPTENVVTACDWRTEPIGLIKGMIMAD
jgi:hypothetical protein